MDATVAVLTPFSAIQDALQRCLTENPPTGPECALCRDASLIADIYGEMAYRRQAAIDLGTVKPERADAVRRWLALQG